MRSMPQSKPGDLVKRYPTFTISHDNLYRPELGLAADRCSPEQERENDSRSLHHLCDCNTNGSSNDLNNLTETASGNEIGTHPFLGQPNSTLCKFGKSRRNATASFTKLSESAPGFLVLMSVDDKVSLQCHCWCHI